MTPTESTYDAVLLTSFGGPEGHDEVMPFLRNVVAGRDVPDDRLAEVAEHYHANDGRSPINDQNRALVAALEDEFADRGIDLPILFGNRNWHPLLADTLRDADAAGQHRLLALVTSAYSSYSGCRQYREDLAAARDEAGVDVAIDKVRVYFNHPGFVSAQADRVRTSLAELDPDLRTDARLVFVTHSIPLTMARHASYVAQHQEACRLVVEVLADDDEVDWRGGWDLVFCSRSGPPQVPWLEPDVNDHLAALAAADTPAVVVVPVGFVSDHMEVIHDLDVEAAETADDLDLVMERAGTVGTHPDFVAGLADLVAERTTGGPRDSLGTMGPWHDACPLDCCRIPDREYPSAVADAPPTRRPTG
ncbi:ferrochelatase [Salsipaludibacter albus]|uniref:ferrochelatase n=1 Tax=Salsipaludibacter albus TaxID=2849650 RepID=UPI001EE48E07|nr:ferrochelatase [Salsipaludibacter albus]MBY5163422.1 ferrochelatase [Salsipaludibacter albus]